MISALQHKLPLLVDKTLQEMCRLAGEAPCSPELFARMKEKQLRSYYNYLFWQPYYHCLVGTVVCLEEPR